MPTELPALGPGFTLAGAPPPDLTPTQVAVRQAILDRESPDHYERIPCPCRSIAGDRLLSEVDRHGIPSRYVICLGCGLIRLSPRWREDRYREFYQSEYRRLYSRTLAPKATYAAEIERNPATRERATWIEQEARCHGLPPKPRVVEIGAGAGWNLARLPGWWSRIGFDVDQEFLDIGGASFGLDMRYGFVEEALVEVTAADLVLLSHVVEHFSDPNEVLEKISRHLRPGALLLIEVPGIFRIHRTNLDVRTYLQNAHTFTYCGATLADACRRAGLEVLGLDETARAVCRRAAGAGGAPGNNPRLSEHILTYLRRCDFGYRQYRRVGKAPMLGRYLAYGWKRTYFPAVGLIATWSVK